MRSKSARASLVPEKRRGKNFAFILRPTAWGTGLGLAGRSCPRLGGYEPPILFLSNASSLRSSSWAAFSSSFVHDCKSFCGSSPLLLQMPPSTFSLNFLSNSSLVFRMRVGCLWKSSHASSFLRGRRSSCSVGFPRCTSPFVKFGPRGCVDGARVVDRSRALRNPLVGAKAPLSAGTRLSVSKGALVSAWFFSFRHHCGLVV